MATFVFTDGYVEINSVDLSDHVRQVTLDAGVELQDASAMGVGTRTNNPGLKTWTVTVEFLQDFAAGEVDATIFPLMGTTFTVEVRPTSAARSATNPGYSGTGTIASYTPMGGAVGDQAASTVTIAAVGALSRLTA